MKSKSHFLGLKDRERTVCGELVAGLRGQGRARRASSEGSSEPITSKDLMRQEKTLRIWAARLHCQRRRESELGKQRELEISFVVELLP